MATLVFVHAHPDDEASQTSGSMARAVAEGHRVVLVVATDGAHGDTPEDLLPGETLADRRRGELHASARVLGVHRVEWLGYADSGMAGWEQNDHEHAFVQAALDEAAGRLADLLLAEDAQVVTAYDWHGGYGHPDHIQVHRVVHRAAELTAQRGGRRPRVLEVTMNRDRMRALMQAARGAGMPESDGFDPDAPMGDGNPIGTPENEIHWQVDVAAYLPLRRESLACHASQTSDVGMMLGLPPEAFAAFFGAEHYVEAGLTPGLRRGWFLDQRSEPV